MYLENNKDLALIAKKKEELPFTEKSEMQSPMKKARKGKKQEKEIIPPSETYLQSATKENPISIGREVSPPNIDMSMSN